MPSISKCIAIFSLALSAVALSHGGHMARSSRHDIGARAPVAAPMSPVVAAPIKKRASNSNRCKAKASSSSSSSSSTSKSSAQATTSKPVKADVQPTPAPAPTTSSSKYTPPPPPTTTKKAAPTSASSGGLTTGGISTFFTQNGVAGACGTVHPDSAVICALQTQTYANGAKCGDYVQITNLLNGITISVLVADECPSCQNAQSIDLSEGAFQALGGTVAEGEFPIAFKFL